VCIATKQVIWDTLPLIQNDHVDDDLVTHFFLHSGYSSSFFPDSRDLKNNVG